MHIPSVSNDVIRATTEETPPGVCGSRQRDAPARRSPQQRRGTSPPHSADDDLLAVAQRHERIDACLRIAQPSILLLRQSPIQKENEYYREINSQSQPTLGELALH